MSLKNINILGSPTLGGVEFDAVLEDTFEAEVETTGYTIELGARVSDHRIVKPQKWRLTAAISNTPFSSAEVLAQAGSGALSNVIGDGALSGLIGGTLGNSLLGDNSTRAATALDFLIKLMTEEEPFDVDAGDIQLKDMIITNLSRTKDPSNEGGLIFQAELKEYFTLSTTLSKNQPNDSELNPDDPASSQASSTKNDGQSEPFVLTESTYKLLQNDFPVFDGVDI